jgi:uncharacterized protein YukE
MSGGMDIDLELLEAFLSEVKVFDRELAESLDRSSTEFARLGEGWRDERYQEFSDDWHGAEEAIRRYIEQSVENIGFLEDKARQVRDYLRRG